MKKPMILKLRNLILEEYGKLNSPATKIDLDDFYTAIEDAIYKIANVDDPEDLPKDLYRLLDNLRSTSYEVSMGKNGYDIELGKTTIDQMLSQLKTAKLYDKIKKDPGVIKSLKTITTTMKNLSRGQNKNVIDIEISFGEHTSKPLYQGGVLSDSAGTFYRGKVKSGKLDAKTITDINKLIKPFKVDIDASPGQDTIFIHVNFSNLAKSVKALSDSIKLITTKFPNININVLKWK